MERTIQRKMWLIIKINKGEKIIKYDQLIGIASKDILVGDHVHVENTDFKSTDHDYEYSTSIKLPNMIEPEKRPTFKGYKRPNGKVGTRNYIGILTSVNCSATAARNIAEVFTKDKLSQYKKDVVNKDTNNIFSFFILVLSFKSISKISSSKLSAEKTLILFSFFKDNSNH